MATTIREKTYVQVEERENITIGIAANFLEKMEIYRFRYQVYAEEMSKQFPAMDHANKLLFDDLDKWGVLLYAKAGQQIIGTVRVNIGRLIDFPLFWAKNLSLDRFQKYYGQNNEAEFAYSSKLLIAPAYRNSIAAPMLSAKVYELCCDQVQFGFGVCNLYLLRFYEQLGFRQVGQHFIDPGYGLLAPYVLLLDDIEHLRTVRSPFFRLARKRKLQNKDIVAWFRSEFTENSTILNSQLIDEEDLWAFLQQRLGHALERMIPVLYGISASEAQKFLHCCGIVVQCRAGDQIVTSGISSYDLNILISGELESPRSMQNKLRILPGQEFGVNGLVEHPKQTADITAATDAEILVLSSLAFPKFRHAYPAAADRILRNITSTAHEALNL